MRLLERVERLETIVAQLEKDVAKLKERKTVKAAAETGKTETAKTAPKAKKTTSK